MARSKKQPKDSPVYYGQESRWVVMTPEDRNEVEKVAEHHLARIGELVLDKARLVAANNAETKIAKDAYEAKVLLLQKGEVEVLCNLEPDFHEGQMRFRRVDTNVMVYTRPLDATERQRPLFFDTKGGGTNTASDAAKAKQPGLNDLPDDAPTDGAARLTALGWVRDADGKLAPEGEAKAALEALGDATAALVLERANAGLDGDLALAWGRDRKTLVDQVPELVAEHGQEKVDTMLVATVRDDLACAVALELLRGTLTEDEARAKPKACDPPPASPEAASAAFVEPTDEERAALKADLGVDTDEPVEAALVLMRAGATRESAVRQVKREEEKREADEARKGATPAAIEKANALARKLAPKLGVCLSELVRDDVLSGVRKTEAKEKAEIALAEGKALSPEELAELGGEGEYLDHFLAALYAGGDRNEAHLDAKLAYQRHLSAVEAAKALEQANAADGDAEGQDAPVATPDAPAESIADAAKAAFDASLPVKPVRRRKADKAEGAVG